MRRVDMVVITTVPQASSEFERFAYLGLEPNFAQTLADPTVIGSVPAGTKPTIRAALELYDQAWTPPSAHAPPSGDQPAHRSGAG